MTVFHDQTTLPRERSAKPLTLARAADDYAIVRRAIAYMSEHWRDQPEIEAVAHAAGLTADELHHLFRRWAGLTPKEFLQALTLDHARRLLREVAGGGEGGRRRPDVALRLPPFPVRRRPGDRDRARSRRPRLCRSGRGVLG